MARITDTFYFLKVEISIDRCEEVAAVERMKHGPEYLWLWIRLALRYANYEGVLCRRIGDSVFPVSPDDLEAEMRGGFTDVSIKDGIKTLIDASLIYINSDGFMAITGLTITGDPREPVLHRQNSNEAIVRPLSVGKDSRSAQYQRSRRKLISQAKEVRRLAEPEYAAVPYSDIVKAAGCSKSTVANKVRKMGFEDRVILSGQKKYLPKREAELLIRLIKGEISPDDPALLSAPESVDSTETLDTLDGLDGHRPLSKTVHEPSILDSPTVQKPSNLDSEPSKDGAEKPLFISTLDGLSNEISNETPGETPDETPALIESKELKNKDDEYKQTAAPENEPDWLELFSVGYDRKPNFRDLAALMDLCERYPFSIVLDALKTARKYHADSVAYAVRCAEEAARAAETGAALQEEFDPERSVSGILNLLQGENLTEEEAEEAAQAVKRAKRYWTDGEILKALANISAYRTTFNRTMLDFFLRAQHLPPQEMERKLYRSGIAEMPSYTRAEEAFPAERTEGR